MDEKAKKFLEEISKRPPRIDWAASPSSPHDQDYARARSAVSRYISPAVSQSFDDIIGNEAALAQLRDAIEAPVLHADLYAAYGLTAPKGVLLSGPPGCGKTMFARAAAAQLSILYEQPVEFLALAGPELQSSYVGETERRITAIFHYARLYKEKHGIPLLVFIDEAETILPDRTGRTRRVYPWEESQVAAFLSGMDGLHASGAFILLATNRPEAIDSAVLRDGRCDMKITVEMPTQRAVEAILRRNFAGTHCRDFDELIFAALEALYDPHKIIAEAHKITYDGKKFSESGGSNFCLEHILSGAMVASIPARATRYAFGRDKATGNLTGVTPDDVLAAVNDLFEENKRLEHPYAVDKFMEEFISRADPAQTRKMN